MANTIIGYNFRASAIKETTLSDLMVGRTQLTTDDIVGETLTVEEFDIIAMNGKQYAIVVFKEYPDRYYNGGMVLTKIVLNWIADFDGDIIATSEALQKSGGVQFKFNVGKTKDGKRNLTTVEVV